MADGYIDIDVKLNGSPAESQADALGKKLGSQVSKGVDQAGNEAKKSTNQALNEIGGTLTSFGAKYSKAVTLPIAAAAVATGASAVKIDTALTGVRKTVDGTEEQYEALKNAAIEFSKTNAVDPAQILDIQALGAQLGYTIDELDMFGEVVSGLDIATNMQADEAATELAQFANIMGMAHDETKNYGSTIVDLGNNFATTEADISSMAMRIAGAGKQIGMSEADVLGLATALSSMGIEAEAGGTAISTIMANIDKSVARATVGIKDYADQAGMSVADFTAALRDSGDQFEGLAEANGLTVKKLQSEVSNSLETLNLWAETAGMSADQFAEAWGNNAVDALSSVLVGMDSATQAGGNMSVMLDELGITSIRQTDTFKRLASNSEFLGKAIGTANKAWEENTALDKEVENRNNSMAAQLEILKNKVQAVAIEVGEPLMHALLDIIDAAQPFIDALASGAKAFSDLDEGGQKAVLMAVGVVAAFGPMVGIVGKVTTGLTNNAQTWKKFSENLKTVRTNIANATTEVTKQAAAQSKYHTIMAGGQPAIVKYNAETKKMQVVQTATTNATKAQTVAMKASTTATKAGAVAMNTAKVAGQGLRAVMSTLLPVLVLTVGIEAFTALSGAMEKSREKAETFKKATDGITKSMDAYNKAFDDTKASMDNAAKGADTVKASFADVRDAADEAITKTAELADSLNDSFSEVGTNNALVQTYADTIQDLTNKYDENGIKASLSAEEQGELITAVEGLNEIMGTSYDVVDAQNGILNTNTTEIMKSADAWQKRALMEAQAAASSDIMKRMIENTTALNKAEDVLTTTQEKLAQAEKNGVQDLTDYRLGVEQAQAEVDRLKGVQEGLEQEQKDLNKSVAELNNELNSSADSLKSHISNMEGFGKALEDAEVDADDFAKKLSDIGVSTEDLSRVMKERGEDGIQQMIDAYKDGGESLEKWFTDDFGVKLGDASRDATKSAADNIVDGFSGETLRIANAVEGVVGVSKQEFAKMADGAGVSGEQAIAALALAIADGSVTVESSAEEINAAVESKLAEMDGETPAGAVVDQITKTFAAKQNEAEGAAAAIEKVSQLALNRLDGKTPAAKATKQFTTTVRLAAPDARSASESVALASAGGMQSQNGNAGGWGSHLVQNFANGIRGAINWVVGAANSVASVISNILGHTVPKEGILREGGRGEAVWGEHLVQNVADGMTSNRAKRAIKEASREVAVDINDTLLAEMARIDPMAQIEESLAKGSAAFQMSAMVSGTAPSYNTNSQTLNFNSPVSSPDEIARTMRMQQRYGLAGQNL